VTSQDPVLGLAGAPANINNRPKNYYTEQAAAFAVLQEAQSHGATALTTHLLKLSRAQVKEPPTPASPLRQTSGPSELWHTSCCSSSAPFPQACLRQKSGSESQRSGSCRGSSMTPLAFGHCSNRCCSASIGTRRKGHQHRPWWLHGQTFWTLLL
jgi:hypothetical protein